MAVIVGILLGAGSPILDKASIEHLALPVIGVIDGKHQQHQDETIVAAPIEEL